MSSNPKNKLLTIHMRKTQKRVTATTKLQALARGERCHCQEATETSLSTICLQVLPV